MIGQRTSTSSCCIFSVAAVCCLALLAWLLHLAPWQSSQAAPVNLGTNKWLGYEPGYVASRHGLYGDTKVQLSQFPSASETLQAFRDGRIDVAGVTLDEAFLLARRGAAIKIILVADISNGADAIMAQPDIRSMGNLRGKKVGVENTALGDYVLARALQIHGLGDSEITQVPLTADQTVTAFSSKEVNAVVTFEPFKSSIAKLGGIKIFDSSEIPDEVVDVLIVRSEFARQNPAAVKAIVGGWLKANELVRKRDPDVMREMADRLGTTEDDLKRTLQDIKIPSLVENVDLLNSPGGLAATSKKLAPVLDRRNRAAIPFDPWLLLSAEFLPEEAP